MRAVTLILFYLLSIVAMGCSDGDVLPADEQEVYFEVTYSNQAWGKQFKGMLIDKDGKIRKYDLPAKWNVNDGKSGLTLVQMRENVANTTLSTETISVQDLKGNVDKISKLTETNITKAVSGGADRGSTVYYAYRYDASKQVYMPVFLQETGDWESYNKDAGAVQLSSWLASVLDSVFK
jgi:hypothetical protein